MWGSGMSPTPFGIIKNKRHHEALDNQVPKLRKPYRDKLGRFAKRPQRKRKKSYVEQIIDYVPLDLGMGLWRELSLPGYVLPPIPHPLERKRPKKHTRIEKEKEKEKTPTRVPQRKRKITKKAKEWEDLNDILDSYIEDLDLDEDIVGGS